MVDDFGMFHHTFVKHVPEEIEQRLKQLLATETPCTSPFPLEYQINCVTQRVHQHHERIKRADVLFKTDWLLAALGFHSEKLKTKHLVNSMEIRNLRLDIWVLLFHPAKRVGG